MKKRSPRAITLAFPILLLLIAAPSALAHAILVRSSPADQSVVHNGDLNIVLDYDSRVDARRSTIILTKNGGQRIPLTIGSSGKPFELNAMAKDLSNGQYAILWQVLASDGHVTRGTVTFRIAVK